MEVGIRELKSHLSRYIAAVVDGTAIVITDRGTPVARLVAINEGSNLERGLDEGWIEPSRRNALTPAAPVAGNAAISSALDKDRG